MSAAVERYKPHALTEREEKRIQVTAEQLAKSSLVPSSLKGKPADIALVLQKGHELGIDGYMARIENLHPYDGRIISSAAIARRQATRAGHEMWPEEIGPESCTFAGHRRGHPERVTRVTWTLKMAAAAGLTNKDTWKKYPAQMLAARASKMWVVLNCPEVLIDGDDGSVFYEDIAGLPENGAAAEGPDGAALVDTEDDDITDAEIVDTVPFPQYWADRCKTNGVTQADSARILTFVCGVERARDVPADKQDEAHEALDAWLAGELELGAP